MDQFRQIVDVKVMGTAFALKYELEAMRATGGGPSSIRRRLPPPSIGGLHPAASASQATVLELTKG